MLAVQQSHRCLWKTVKVGVHVTVEYRVRLQLMVENDFTPAYIDNFLRGLTPQNTQAETIFQVDPNQLLSVSGGYKVLLRRPLGG